MVVAIAARSSKKTSRSRTTAKSAVPSSARHGPPGEILSTVMKIWDEQA
jgi:hypothetical protein